MLTLFSNFDATTKTWELGSYCLLSHKQYCKEGEESSLVMVDKYHGQVIREYENNYYDDSDFKAVVWNTETNKPFEVVYATTRGWSYSCACTIDATPEIIEAYNAYVKAEEIKLNAIKRKTTPKLDMIARSLTKKGKAKGAEGTIVWIGETAYTNKSVRLDSQHGVVYVDVKSLELFDTETGTWNKSAEFSKQTGWNYPV